MRNNETIKMIKEENLKKVILRKILNSDLNEELKNSRIKNEEEKEKLMNALINFFMNEKFNETAKLEKIIIVGKAGSGKSTLHNKIRNFIESTSKDLNVKLVINEDKRSVCDNYFSDYFSNETFSLIEIMEVYEYDKNLEFGDNIIINL